MGDRTEHGRFGLEGALAWWDRVVPGVAAVPAAHDPATTAAPSSTTPASPRPAPKRPPPITLDSHRTLFGMMGHGWLIDSLARLRRNIRQYLIDDFETQLRQPQESTRIVLGFASRLGVRLLLQQLPKPEAVEWAHGRYRVPFPEGGLALAVSHLPEEFVYAFIPNRYGFRGAVDFAPAVEFGLRVVRRGNTSLLLSIESIDGVALRTWTGSSAYAIRRIEIDLADNRACLTVAYEPALETPAYCTAPEDAWRITAQELASTTAIIAKTQTILDTATNIFSGRWLLRSAE